MRQPEGLSEEREAQIKRILRAVEEKLRQELPEGPRALEEIEQTVEQVGEEIKQTIQSEILAGLGSGYTGATRACACGALARHKADAVRSVLTLHGEVAIARAYYYCSRCKRGFHPLDRVLALGRGQCSLRVRALACRFASYLPFAVAARELALVCGVHLSASSLQRIAKATGATLGQEWQARQERLRKPAPPDPTGSAPQQLHLSMDGVLVHVEGVWREVKLGVCYERANEQGPTHAAY